MTQPTRLTTSTSRTRLTRGQRFFDVIAPGVALVYRRGAKPGVDGKWAVRVLSRTGASGYTLEALGNADDLTKADGVDWLSYQQAVERALSMAKRAVATARAPLTVGEACTTYVERLRNRNGTARPPA